MNYEEILYKHDLKVTPQRVGILTLMDKYGHISIDELFEEIKKRFPSISLATLYKNINLMMDNTLITEIKIPNMKSKYEITKANHLHLLCNNCGEIKDLSVDMNMFLEDVQKKSRYKVTGNEIVLSGICKSCQ